VRERTNKLVRSLALDDPKPFTPLCITRVAGKETQLWVKEVAVAGRRYRLPQRYSAGVKATMRTRPIYHSPDEAIRGHVFRSSPRCCAGT
jgi:hypothetical protein